MGGSASSILPEAGRTTTAPAPECRAPGCGLTRRSGKRTREPALVPQKSRRRWRLSYAQRNMLWALGALTVCLLSALVALVLLWLLGEFLTSMVRPRL